VQQCYIMTTTGLTSQEALSLLSSHLQSTLSTCSAKRSALTWMWEAWLPGSVRSLFRLTSMVFCLLLSLALLATRNSYPEMVSAVVVLIMVVANLMLSGWESYQRSVEVFRRVERLVEVVEQAARQPAWEAENYPHLHTPLSASIVLQWTIRDTNQVNLPWALLVKGDIVLIKPGQMAPGRCSIISEKVELRLDQGETFHTDKFKPVEKSLLPEFKSSLSPQKFLLLETPFLSELQEVLHKAAHRPLSKLTKQRHFLISSLLEYICTPLVLVVVLAWNCVRHQHSWSWLSGHPKYQLFLTEPVSATLPLLPLLLPAWWILVNTAGLANVLALFRHSTTLTTTSDPFDDTVETPDMEETVPAVSWPYTRDTFWSCLLGTGEHLSRTENILHCLGSVTSHCCTDKKGILSWPNTSPEKIFFLKSGEKQEMEEESMSEDGESEEEEEEGQAVTPEILTVTQDHSNPFRVEFDDPAWSRHLSSLKPLGLSVRLNTCNLATEEKYTDFYNYLVCESAREPLLKPGKDTVKPDLLPIPARGCLCEISFRIGFKPGVETGWELEQQLQTFRPVVSDSPGTSFTRNLTMAKLKFPFPHQVSVLARERKEGRLQLLTQGTADIVLDSCVDCWTGTDLLSLTDQTRKKCLEFYHRASLTSYCSAFSYRPVTERPPWPGTATTSQYMELPPNSSPFLSQATAQSEEDIDRVSIGPCGERSMSTDSGVFCSSQEVSACLETQCNQSFLGMVQMQYQARVDMVQFIDLLEKACIRFVHFSKENELRSRVFSEKMGLESGWNCHISLHSQADLSTAPSIMYGRKRVTKKFSADSDKKKHFLSASLPSKMNKDSRFLDFPQWGDTGRPLLVGKESQGTEESQEGSTSTSSMLQYDMSNRAQLPAGIENIRPHLEEMDNVPLLVSLFTDCTPPTTRQMVEILQENGEVVAMMGSSANYHNISIFLSADASLAVEPLYPQVCQHVPVFTSPQRGMMAPTDLARHFTAVASSVSFKREEELSVYHAIIASRRHVLAIRHGLQFWVSSSMFLSMVVLVSLLIMLPSPLSPPQMLVLSSLYLPLLATASFFSAHDTNIRNISTGKNSPIMFTRATLCHTLWCYGLRFLPALVSTSLAHLLSILHLQTLCTDQVDCSNFLATKLSFLTDTNMTFVTISVVLASLSYVSRTDHMWQYKPRRSWHILITSLVVVVVQLLYFTIRLMPDHVDTLPVWAWMVHLGFIPVVVVVNELVKRHEIKLNVRFQKRARLDFNTKLGINSPF